MGELSVKERKKGEGLSCKDRRKRGGGGGRQLSNIKITRYERFK